VFVFNKLPIIKADIKKLTIYFCVLEEYITFAGEISESSEKSAVASRRKGIIE